MEIDSTVIRGFRSSLRQFERIIGGHNRTCCAQVTLSQCHVLLEIDAAKRITGSELAQRLGLDISTISRTVDGLVKKGLVIRREHPGDRRAILLQATVAGSRLSRQINRDADGFYAAVLARIPKPRRDAVVKSFLTLTAAFTAEDQRSGATSACCCIRSDRDARR